MASLPTQDSLQAMLLKELGLGGFSPQAQQEAIAAMAGPVWQHVTLALMLKLPDEPTREQFQKALAAGDGATVEALIAAHIPNASALVEAEVRAAMGRFKAALAA